MLIGLRVKKTLMAIFKAQYKVKKPSFFTEKNINWVFKNQW